MWPEKPVTGTKNEGEAGPEPTTAMPQNYSLTTQPQQEANSVHLTAVLSLQTGTPGWEAIAYGPKRALYW